MTFTLRSLVLIFLAGCSEGPHVRPEARVDTSSPNLTAGNASAGPNTAVLATYGPDTVRVAPDHDNNVLVWTTYLNGSRVVRWQSRPLHSAVPSVSLRTVDGDSLPDLFWTIRYDEIIGGMLLLGTDDGARTAFQTDERACRIPELVDVTQDGRLDLVEFLPGAFRPEDCQSDPLTILCQAAYPTEWPIVWVQNDSGFAPDLSKAHGFYSEQGAAFARASTQIRKQQAGTTVNEAESPCASRVADSLARMAVLAVGIGASP